MESHEPAGVDPVDAEQQPLATGGWSHGKDGRDGADRSASPPAPTTERQSNITSRDEDAPPSPRAPSSVSAARGRERADALELQLAQKEAALGRTRIAAERSAQLAAQAQAEAARLRSELDDARELRLAAMAEAREWRSTAEASSESASSATAKVRQLEEELQGARATARAAGEAAEQAEAAAQSTLARSFSQEERRQLKDALEAAQRRADELAAQAGTAESTGNPSRGRRDRGAAARHEVSVREQKLAELQASHESDMVRPRASFAEQQAACAR